MTNEEKINRLRNIQGQTPIYTRDDSRDLEALEAAIEAIKILDWTKNKLGNVFTELTEEKAARNLLMAVSGMSTEELADAFMKGYSLRSPEAVKDEVPDDLKPKAWMPLPKPYKAERSGEE